MSEETILKLNYESILPLLTEKQRHYEKNNSQTTSHC